MKMTRQFFLGFMLLCTACHGQDSPGNICELDFSKDEISMELTLGDIAFEEPAILDAVIKANRSYLYKDTLSTPIKYIEQIILNHTPLKTTRDLQYFIKLKKLIISNEEISCINLSNNVNIERSDEHKYELKSLI